MTIGQGHLCAGQMYPAHADCGTIATVKKGGYWKPEHINFFEVCEKIRIFTRWYTAILKNKQICPNWLVS